MYMYLYLSKASGSFRVCFNQFPTNQWLGGTYAYFVEYDGYSFPIKNAEDCFTPRNTCVLSFYVLNTQLGNSAEPPNFIA